MKLEKLSNIMEFMKFVNSLEALGVFWYIPSMPDPIWNPMTEEKIWEFVHSYFDLHQRRRVIAPEKGNALESLHSLIKLFQKTNPPNPLSERRKRTEDQAISEWNRFKGMLLLKSEVSDWLNEKKTISREESVDRYIDFTQGICIAIAMGQDYKPEPQFLTWNPPGVLPVLLPIYIVEFPPIIALINFYIDSIRKLDLTIRQSICHWTQHEVAQELCMTVNASYHTKRKLNITIASPFIPSLPAQNLLTQVILSLSKRINRITFICHDLQHLAQSIQKHYNMLDFGDTPNIFGFTSPALPSELFGLIASTYELLITVTSLKPHMSGVQHVKCFHVCESHTYAGDSNLVSYHETVVASNKYIPHARLLFEQKPPFQLFQEEQILEKGEVPEGEEKAALPQQEEKAVEQAKEEKPAQVEELRQAGQELPPPKGREKRKRTKPL